MAGGSDTIIKIGPFGSTNNFYDPETIWDEKGHSNIVQIFISHQETINSFQYQYVENGKLMLSQLFGTQCGYKYDAVTLNYPEEYITSIRGYRNRDLSSISFGTNLGEYGPFGKNVETGDTEFQIKLGGNQFFGFHGSTKNGFINSIGVYMKMNMTLDLVKKERKK